jgi:DNA-binding IclR family transcriptional regulator
MRAGGTIERTAQVLRVLMSGAVLERHALADAFGISLAAADRYIRTLQVVPGVVVKKQGRRLLVSFSFGAALVELGR